MQLLSKFIFRSPLNPQSSKTISPNFLLAIYLASPDLYYEFLNQSKVPMIDKRVQNSINKYLIRAGHRCTPFGLFAGVGIGEWGNENIILLGNADETSNIKSTLDTSVSYQIARLLESKPSMQSVIKYFPNQSHYHIDGSIRYIEKNEKKLGGDSYHVTKVIANEYLNQILESARYGRTKSQLASSLQSIGIDFNDALSYINELINSQLLISELEPNTIGDEYFDTILRFISTAIKVTHDSEIIAINNELLQIKDILDQNIFLSELNINKFQNIYKKINAIVPNLEEKNFLKADLFKMPIESCLSMKVQHDLNTSLDFLLKIALPSVNSDFARFKEKFFERYEENEIPLLTVLDSQIGIGYPSDIANEPNELLDGFDWIGNDNSNKTKWDPFHKKLLEILEQSIRNKEYVLQLKDSYFENNKGHQILLPDSLSIVFRILDRKESKIQIIGVNNDSINLLSRFANGHKGVREIVNEISNFEQSKNEDVILAEIVHSPHIKAANILHRPSFREFEIPYLGKTSKTPQFVIDVRNLYLQIQNNKMILFDYRSKKQIIPRMSTAYNYKTSELPVFRFLCDLQNSSLTNSIGFNWGFLKNKFAFLPRVEYNKVILHPAQWRIQKSDIKRLYEKHLTQDETINFFKEVQIKYSLPNVFLIGYGDNQLVINSIESASVEIFIQETKKFDIIVISESISSKENGLITDSKGNVYENECIAVFFNDKLVNRTIFVPPKEKQGIVKYFSVGSEWVYFKIYCGTSTIDSILKNAIKDVLSILKEDSVIDAWFFVRYADPESHLRIRFHLVNAKRLNYILEEINKKLDPLLRKSIIYKIQTDTYQRELNRYGVNSIEFIEQIFYADSEFVVDSISELERSNEVISRWQIAFLSVEQYLADFKYNQNKKIEFVSKMYNICLNEYSPKKEIKVFLDTKFRELGRQVQTLSSGDRNDVYSLLKRRSENSERSIQKLLEMEKEGILQPSLEKQISSIIHMNINRIFMSKNRINELAIYYFIKKHNTGIQKRALY